MRMNLAFGRATGPRGRDRPFPQTCGVLVGPRPGHGRLGMGFGSHPQKRATRVRSSPQPALRAAACRASPLIFISFSTLSTGRSRALEAEAPVIKYIVAAAVCPCKSCYLSSTSAVPLEKTHFTDTV